MVSIEDILHFKDFAQVCTDNLNEAGLPKGSLVFVAGSQAIPEDKEDPYNLRTKLIVCPLMNYHILNDKFLMIDPRNVFKVAKEMQEELTKIMFEDFGSNTEGEATH